MKWIFNHLLIYYNKYSTFKLNYRLHTRFLNKMNKDAFDRTKMEELIKRRFLYDISFSIYGGVAGLYDMGPIGCAMKSNLLNMWRKFFILEEQMLEVDCSILTPEPVLKASGHVDRFSDFMVKDVETNDCFRVDHLIKNFIENLLKPKPANAKSGDGRGKDAGPKVTIAITPELVLECETVLNRLDDYKPEQFDELIRRFNMRSPVTGNELSSPLPFNLMFATHIGPSGLIKGYLRPETAQGIFVNFKRLLEFNQGKLPFAAAQIGNAFRNEISPRSGLLRVREFTMAEIEHFVDPADKSHPKFEEVCNLELRLYPAPSQLCGEPPMLYKLGEAVDKKMIANQTLGYFMARIYLFLKEAGVAEDRIRFRQHMNNEMAHYACDCWDAECLTSYGWVECVGCADRSCYDLNQHHKATNVKLVAEKILPEPVKKEYLGKVFTKNSKFVLGYFSTLNEPELAEVAQKFEGQKSIEITAPDGKVYTVTPEMVNVKRYEKKIHVEEYTPSVIEPSFGIGRIMYSILEHNFRVRDKDEKRTYFALPPSIAPYKCSILPLSGNNSFKPYVKTLSKAFTLLNISHKIDESGGSIGRRYARTDEIAIPFGVTIDFDSLVEPATATLRDRDSMRQIRANLDEIPQLVADLCEGKLIWSDVETLYPQFVQQETTKLASMELNENNAG